MSDDKVYTPEVLDNHWAEILGTPESKVSNGGTGGVYTPSTTTTGTLPTGTTATELISAHLDTVKKRVLGEFKFSTLGAFMIGTVGGASVRMSQAGLYGTDVNGATTFGIDATTGEAYFKGTVAAGSLITGYIQVHGAASDVNGGSTTINGGMLTTNTITGNKIVAGTITADKLSVTTLSAITANLGNITAGTITGATIQTATSGTRVVLNSSGATVYGTGLYFDGIGFAGLIGNYLTFGIVSSGKGIAITADSGGIVFTKTGGDFLFGSNQLRFSDSKYLTMQQSLMLQNGNPGFGNSQRLTLENSSELWVKDNWRFAFGSTDTTPHIYASYNGGNFNQIV